MLTRRELFLASLGVPAALSSRMSAASSQSLAAPALSGSLDPWVTVLSANLQHNVREIARRAGGRPILAVIKNNGYGLGVVNVARLLEPRAEIAGFAVVKLHEAVALRDAGVRKPILLMGPVTDGELVDELAPRRIMPMVYRDYGAAFDRAAARAGGPIALHVKIDTGMGRVGIPHEDAAPLLASLAARASVRIEGVMTTLTEDEGFEPEQLRRLSALAAVLRAKGIDVGRQHAASSYALFLNEPAFLDMVRPGMALLGIYSEPRFRDLGRLDLRPAVALHARIAQVKRLDAGESAGYNRAYTAKVPTWIATLPVGHADGWPRAAAKGAKVRIGKGLYPVIASVSASHTLVEIGPERPAEIEVGGIVDLFNDQDGSRPEDVAAACGASVYDLTMHLSPLLPRRVAGS